MYLIYQTFSNESEQKSWLSIQNVCMNFIKKHSRIKQDRLLEQIMWQLSNLLLLKTKIGTYVKVLYDKY